MYRSHERLYGPIRRDRLLDPTLLAQASAQEVEVRRRKAVPLIQSGVDSDRLKATEIQQQTNRRR
ncbi:hypothetical protein ACIRYZ_45475 [Kitasatospora sp. NPDC101155]|uniref:hypothetical protein n=1 Tax=Kitasatospora sp. NPDC101155 TaxID=3364097 RepID=UPI0037FAC1AF